MELCPDGYEGNNSTFVCDQCALGRYSYQNKCYSECPLFYSGNDQTRACTLSGGYPLNMTIKVITNDTIEFEILFPLTLRTDSLSNLDTNWQSEISLYMIKRSEPNATNERILASRKLQSAAAPIGTLIDITAVIVSESKLIIKTTKISQDDLTYSADF